jgi:hypothetical protein
MFAVMSSGQADWDSLPESFRQSVHTTIDDTVNMFGANTTATPTVEQRSAPTQVKPLHRHGGSVASLERECTDLMKELKSIVYDLKDGNHLKGVRDGLQELIVKYGKLRVFDEGLPLRVEWRNDEELPTESAQLITSTDTPCLGTTEVPEVDGPEVVVTSGAVRRLTKRASRHPAAGRHGSVASMKRAHIHVAVAVDKDGVLPRPSSEPSEEPRQTPSAADMSVVNKRYLESVYGRHYVKGNLPCSKGMQVRRLRLCDHYESDAFKHCYISI